MKVYVLQELWNAESYGHWQTTILGVYSCKDDAERIMRDEKSKLDSDDLRDYDWVVTECTINQSRND